MRIEGSQSGGWLQVEFLKCSISGMTNSLFEKADAESWGAQRRSWGGRVAAAFNQCKTATSPCFPPKTYNVFAGEGLICEDKGSRHLSGYSSWRRRCKRERGRRKKGRRRRCLTAAKTLRQRFKRVKQENY